MYFINVEKYFGQCFFFSYSYCPFLISLSRITIMYMLVYLVVSHRSLRLCSFSMDVCVWEESGWRGVGCTPSDPCPDDFEVAAEQ